MLYRVLYEFSKISNTRLSRNWVHLGRVPLYKIIQLRGYVEVLYSEPPKP